jgi:Protein of unknown function (DUF3048) N-terminal domain/Protein of unknown function (DUF3048) C-terminal domain
VPDDRCRLRNRGAAAAVALVLVAGACTGTPKAERAILSTTTSSSSSTTSTVPPLPIYPLTGVLQPDAAKRQRVALVVKIDNVSPALPQSGVDAADVVFEEMVESQLTRLLAVYQSTDAPRVGPVRSTRTTDLDIVSALNYPLYGYSGGNTGFVAQLRGAAVIDVGAELYPAAYYNSGPHLTPHSLYTSTTALYNLGPAKTRTPPPLFVYRAAGQAVTAAGATPATHLDVSFGDTVAAWDWDPATKTYKRTQDGAPDVEQSGQRLTAANVIVQTIAYSTDGYASGEGIDPPPPIPKGETVGSGTALVMTGGMVIHGRWSKATATAVTQFTDSAGQPILLTPGQTWVELAPVGATPNVH